MFVAECTLRLITHVWMVQAEMAHGDAAIPFAAESRFIIHDTGALHAIRRYIADWEMHPCDFFNNHGRIVPSSGLTHHLFPFHVVHRQEAISCQEVADDTIASA